MDNRVYIEIAPGDVNYVNRIMEGYEYLGILTTIETWADTIPALA